MMPPLIPPRTQAKLRSPAPVGQRHEQMVKIAVSLIGQGLAPDAVLAQLRHTYPRDVSDREIQGVIAWAVGRNPQPCGPKIHRVDSGRPVLTASARITPEQAELNAEKWLGDFRCNECDLWHVSAWRPLEDWKLDSMMLLAALYQQGERVNIVTDYTVSRGKDGEEKANPQGSGKTMLRDEWLRYIRNNGAPEGKAGAWIRPNPVQQRGSGQGGAFTDADVTNYRFALVESDALALKTQLSLWARLPLPLVAIISSGGASYHAWVKMDCLDEAEYRGQVRHILTTLARFAVDPANKNPSRLARLPGAQRSIGAQGEGAQRLVYLNPDPTNEPIFRKQSP